MRPARSNSRRGDILFMYTDGAIEARDPAGDFFGEQRLRDTLLREASSGVDGLCGRMLSALDTFAASALEDDVAWWRCASIWGDLASWLLLGGSLLD